MNPLTLRRLHSYIGLFIAPSVVFFALTGALQLFSLHEEHGNYRPPAIVEKLSSVHKDQVFAFGDHHEHPRAGDGGGAGSGEDKPAESAGAPSTGAPSGAAIRAPAGKMSPAAKEDADEPGLPTFILKIFFLVVGLGITASAVLGMWIGLTQTRNRRTAWLLAAGGALLPIVLLVI